VPFIAIAPLRWVNKAYAEFAIHAHTCAQHCLHFTFGRIHKSLRVTPEMNAEISSHTLDLEEIAGSAN
jgi:hypothetical protein